MAERTEQWVSATRGGAQAEHRTTVSQREGLVLLAHSLGRRAQRAARGELGHRGLQVREQTSATVVELNYDAARGGSESGPGACSSSL